MLDYNDFENGAKRYQKSMEFLHHLDDSNYSKTYYDDDEDIDEVEINQSNILHVNKDI